MKFFIQTIFIAILGFFLELFLPWWSIAIAAFLGGMIFNTNVNFAAGFLGIALLWTLKALLMENAGDTNLTERISQIFFLATPLLFLVTGVIGGLVGGFGAMTGGAVHKRRRRNQYY